VKKKSISGIQAIGGGGGGGGVIGGSELGYSEKVRPREVEVARKISDLRRVTASRRAGILFIYLDDY